MTESQIKEYVNKLVVWMYISFALWICIVVIQLVIGLVTLVFGYGVTTLLLMGYNLFGCIRYFKNIQIIKHYHTKQDAVNLVNYFEKSITPCWIFMFLNLVLGGFIGFVGNLLDLLIAYSVKGKKGMLLMPTNEDYTIIEN